jgi:hypothetical protein
VETASVNERGAGVPTNTPAPSSAPPVDGWFRLVQDERPDWLTGRIVAEDDRNVERLHLGAAIWAVFALGALAAAWRWGGFANYVALGAAGVVGVLVVHMVMRRLRRRKFGVSTLLLDHVPVILGETVSGEVESGIPEALLPAHGFHILLRCVHRWEETVRRGSDRDRYTHYHRDILWETEWQTAGRTSAATNALSIPVRCQLPANLPASTLTWSLEGIRWEVLVTAELDGLDYKAEFQVPVAGPGVPSLPTSNTLSTPIASRNSSS